MSSYSIASSDITHRRASPATPTATTATAPLLVAVVVVVIISVVVIVVVVVVVVISSASSIVPISAPCSSWCCWRPPVQHVLNSWPQTIAQFRAKLFRQIRRICMGVIAVRRRHWAHSQHMCVTHHVRSALEISRKTW